MDQGLENIPLAFAAASGPFSSNHRYFNAGVAAIERCSRLVRQKCKGRARIWLLTCRRQGWIMPHKVLSIIYPEISKILRLLCRILEAPKYNDVVLIVCHPMPTSRGRPLSLG